MDKKDILLRDGHIHSPFCPHGSNDGIELYIKEALRHNLREMTFTEHMDFPVVFLDNKDFFDVCAPDSETILKYFEEVKKYKNIYKDEIKINLGLEVDFLDGYEEKTKEKLNSYCDIIEDCILSTHFIKLNGEFLAVDGKDGFEKALKILGSVEKVYDKYYETLLKAIKSDLGEYKPKRIGHPNLIRKLNKLYPIDYRNYDLLEEIVKEIKKNDYEVDVNTKGLRYDTCKETFVSGYFKKLVDKYNIPKVFGSDSHAAKYVASNFSIKYI